MGRATCPSRAAYSYLRVSARSSRVHAKAAKAADDRMIRLVDSFWSSQGVSDAAAREQILKMSTSQDHVREEEEWISRIPAVSKALSTINDRDILRSEFSRTRAVRFVFQRISLIYSLLGKQDIDLAWMVVRVPQLLDSCLSEETIASSIAYIQNTLLEAREDVDDVPSLLDVVQSHPALICARLDRAESSDVSNAQRIAGWMFGIANQPSDITEFRMRIDQLKQYSEQFGDVHVGGDRVADQQYAGLVKWVKRIRSQYRKREIDSHSEQALNDLGFMWKAEDAAWWANLHDLQKLGGHGGNQAVSSDPEVSRLAHWASIQRICVRAGVLSSGQIDALHRIGFEFSGADPLS